MGDFFKGWRRKTGIVALVMACVFMTGWVRTYSVTDDIHVPLGKTTSFCASSYRRLVERPNGEAKRGLLSLKNSMTASASTWWPSMWPPIFAPVSSSAFAAASAQKATRERLLDGSPVMSVI